MVMRLLGVSGEEVVRLAAAFSSSDSTRMASDMTVLDESVSLPSLLCQRVKTYSKRDVELSGYKMDEVFEINRNRK